MIDWPARAKEQTPDKTGRLYEPWWTRDAISWMESWLKPDMNVLEWGAGSSTVWLVKRVGYVTSMEHNSEWYQRVLRTLNELALADRWQLLRRPLCPAYIDNAIHYALLAGRAIDAVIIDGRLRVQCAERAMKHLKPGGVLLLDNAERKEYERARALLSTWPAIETSNGIWTTNIWTKPRD